MHRRDSMAAAASLSHSMEFASATEGQGRKKKNMFNNRLTTATQVVVIVAALVILMRFARPVVLPVLLAWVVSMMLKPLVRWLQAGRIPAPVGAGIVVTAAVAALTWGTIYLGKPAVDWMQSAPQNVPRLKEKFRHILQPAVQLSEAASSVGNLDSTEDRGKKATPVEVKDHRVTSTVFTWTGTVLAGLGEIIALVFLLLASGDVFMQRLVRVIPAFHDKRKALEVSHEIQTQISRYLFSVGLVNLCFGVVVGLAFFFLGLPNPAMWGTVAALLNFVPYFGPVVGIIGVVLAGLFAFDTLGWALMPALAYLVLHLLEANAITPFVLGRRLLLNPVIIFVALIFSIWLLGVPGALLAMPLLVTVHVICERVPALTALGEFLSGRESLVAGSK